MSASISLRDVSVHFSLYHGGSRSLKRALLSRGTAGRIASDATNRIYVEALKDLSLDIRHGDRVGLIGTNGAGKTTLLRVLAGIYEPTIGQVEINGRVTPMFDIGLGMDMDQSGYENIILRGLLIGLSREEIKKHVADIAEFTELGDYLHMPLRTYSAGMTLRLTFGISTCIAPDILLMDEWVVAGDSKFLHKAQLRLADFIHRSSIMFLASHSNELIRMWCTKALWLENGCLRAFGPVDSVMDEYQAICDAAAKEADAAAGLPEGSSLAASVRRF